MSGLTPGGPTQDDSGLPENWIVPWGWNGENHKGDDPISKAIWVGEKHATDEDFRALVEAGWKFDGRSICGTLNVLWSADQYESGQAKEDIDACVAPWQTYNKPGGDKSPRYKFQHLPEKVDKMSKPGTFVIFADERKGVRTDEEAGETWPVYIKNLGGGVTEQWVVMGLEVTYDTEARLWRVAG